jgi:hypothetical protein
MRSIFVRAPLAILGSNADRGIVLRDVVIAELVAAREYVSIL